MTKESIDFFEANRPMYERFERSGELKNVDFITRDKFLQIIRKEFDPSYQIQAWCENCIATMIKFAYTQYGKYVNSGSI